MDALYWIGLAALAPLLWAFVNHIDKYFLSDKFSNTKVGITGGLMIYSTMFSIVVLPILFWWHPITHALFEVPLLNIATLLFTGILGALSVLLYLIALDQDEASIVVPIFQTIPIFGLIFGYIFLGETLTMWQLAGMFIVIVSSMFLTLDMDIEQGIRIKYKVLFLMLLSSAFFALAYALFKYAALDMYFTDALFFENIGMLMFGSGLLTIARYRKSFMSLLKNNFVKITSLNLTSEGLTVLGNVATQYAIMIAPIALVATIAGLQPIFVLGIGVVMTLFKPHLGEEKISRKHMVHKFVTIAFIVIGGAIISFAS